MIKKEETFWEATCILFWLLLDGFWLLEYRYLTYLCSGVAIIAALIILVEWGHKLEFYLIASADLLWLIMNVLWISYDFYELKLFKTAAIVIFWIAVSLFIIAFNRSNFANATLLVRFRVLNFFRKNS